MYSRNEKFAKLQTRQQRSMLSIHRQRPAGLWQIQLFSVKQWGHRSVRYWNSLILTKILKWKDLCVKDLGLFAKNLESKTETLQNANWNSWKQDQDLLGIDQALRSKTETPWSQMRPLNLIERRFGKRPRFCWWNQNFIYCRVERTAIKQHPIWRLSCYEY